MDNDRIDEQQTVVPPTPNDPTGRTVVGIGASAGGLAALKRLFELMPSDTGLAFVVVVHLSPEHKSHLADLLQPSVRFPVQQVAETTPLEANHVYIIPPNANLSAVDTHLRLSKLEEARRERAPIDHFFRTLAASHDGHAIGVILTGTGSDGTLGLKDIKAKGGLILVQDPNDAEFDGMPQSAVATGLVDRILPLQEIPEALVRLSQVQPGIALDDSEEDRAEQSRALLPKILAILKTRTDRDFARYKSATMLRRIARRMQLNYIEDVEDYFEKLREQPEEARALADDLLVVVTSFFRDPEVFAYLETSLIPKLFERKGPADTLRFWSVGCATGEEAYSLAMLLLEEAARHESPPKLQVFASDLHKRSLDSAREGLYPGDIATDVSPERLRRFFRKENGGYRINKEVREIITFAPHNLLGDPPFSKLHLIACRNLLIYLDRAAQKDVVDLFHYALCPSGCLLLGSAETIDASELFRAEDKSLCLYKKRNVTAPEPRLPVFPMNGPRADIKRVSTVESSGDSVPYYALHQNLLEQFAPPSILVGPDNRVAHLSPTAGRYMLLPGGEATLSAVRVVRDELRIELQRLLQSARDKKQVMDSQPIPVQFNGHAAPVVMHVRPAQLPDQEGFVLVLFEEHQPIAESTSGIVSNQGVIDLDQSQAINRVLELEAELAAARQRLQASVEEYETTQEEMKASAEEMQSTNEELRSTMEELETSKEELQSINEELQTVNQENRHKVEELSQLSSDLQNLLSATEIATLFLDRELRIMRFTPRLADLFNVRVTDRGRPISDLTHSLGYAQLRDDAQSVLERLIPVEREIRDNAERWYLTRVLPYRSTEDRIVGVVITFIDITTQKAAETALSESQARQTFLLKLSDALRSSAGSDEMIGVATRLLGERLGATRVVFAEIDEAAGWARLRQGWAADGAGPHPVTLCLADFGGLLLDDLRAGRTVRFDDVGQPPYSRPDFAALAAIGMFAGLSVPLISNGHFVMNLNVHQGQPRHWTGEEIELVKEVADRTWAAVERARAEEALVKSEEKYRTLFDSIDEGVAIIEIVLDPDGKPVDIRHLETNEAYERHTGLHGVTGKRALEIVSEPDQWLGFYGNVALKGQAARMESYYEHIDRWITSYASRIGGEGSLRVAVVLNDISERKRAEEALHEKELQFRLLVENVQEYALFQADAEGTVTSWNPGAERLFGYTSDEMLGQSVDRLMTAEDQKAGAFAQEIARVLTGEHLEDARWLVRKDGSRFWARWVTEPVRDQSGQVRSVAKVLRDETDRQRASEVTQQSLAEKEELLREVHHRVKNNLQVITSLINLQSAKLEDERLLSLFDETRNRVYSIAAIHELIYQSASFADIDLGSYARELVPSLAHFYSADERIEVLIEADGVRLELERAVPFGLLLNELTSNVFKHAFPDGAKGKLTVGVTRRDGLAILEVADTGVGLPHGFDYRHAQSLGLQLVHSLAKQLRATIDILAGQGTRVRVRIPLQKADTP